nr:replication factor C subunit 2 [Tanacetum cinerariifolium]
IIEPFASRCVKFRFKPLSEDIMSTRILHICNEEGLNLGLEALATLSSISQRDLRRVITFLHRAARLFGSLISSKDLISISRVIPYEVFQALLAAYKSGSFDFANKEVNNVIAEGYPLFDMVVESEDVTDEQKARIFKKLGEPDKGYVIYCPGLFVMVMDSRRYECCCCGYNSMVQALCFPGDVRNDICLRFYDGRVHG